MDLSVSSVQNQQQITNTSAQVGVAAPQTENQRTEASAKSVNNAESSRSLEDYTSSEHLEQKRFENVKSIAANFSSGENPFLSDISFTIYKDVQTAGLGRYEIRFTDISTGKIEIKTESQLFANTSGGDLISGQV
jgi:hypothetical protein